MHIATAAEVNAIANDPDVQARMGAGELDFTVALADDRCVALVDNGFCALFVWTSPFVYEGHVMALPGKRGRNALDLMQEAFGWMKSRGAKMIWGQPSIANRAALWYARRMCMKDHGPGYHPIVGDVRYFVLEDL